MKTMKCMRMFVYLVVFVFDGILNQDLLSPCPHFMTINPESLDVGHWGGTLLMDLDDDTVGLFMQIEMDAKINVLTNNVGTFRTRDNKKFLLEDFNFTPERALNDIIFGIKYNPADVTPHITKIYVNGRLRCPGKASDYLKLTKFTRAEEANGKQDEEHFGEYTTIPYIDIDDE